MYVCTILCNDPYHLSGVCPTRCLWHVHTILGQISREKEEGRGLHEVMVKDNMKIWSGLSPLPSLPAIKMAACLEKLYYAETIYLACSLFLLFLQVFWWLGCIIKRKLLIFRNGMCSKRWGFPILNSPSHLVGFAILCWCDKPSASQWHV